MPLRPPIVCAILLCITSATSVRAQEPGVPAAERLGTVHFATSCRPAVAPQFDRGMALLHSFEFSAAVRAFESVVATDSSCAMAWWGIALARWTNPMVPNLRAPVAIARGQEAVKAAERVLAEASPRERRYVAAVGELYDVARRPAQRARVIAYEQAMEQVTRDWPDDTEARVLHAIALIGAAAPEDKSYANQLRAGATLETLFARYPEHPGLAHYIIHAYDVPALAGRAAEAARRYEQIAPSAAHALHMPSHTFTRVGLWEQSVRTNLRSMEVAEREGSIAEALHAADYAVYAYLQSRMDSAAAAIIARVPALVARFDPAAVTGAAPGSAGVFAIAAMPARYALERDAWREAMVLPVRPSAFGYADAMTYFARAIGAARSGAPTEARGALDSLAAIRARLAAADEHYWAEQVAIQELGARAWLEEAAGRRESALTLMQEASARERASEKAAVTPGPLLPASELLADLLLAHGRVEEAIAQYRLTLTREPGRRRSIEGLARTR